ncbi:MAG: hypothetical protein V4596_12915 [Bdellovibrionota bacterium]
MKKQEYNIPQKGAVKKLREVYNEQLKRKPSDTLIEILREPSARLGCIVDTSILFSANRV